MIEWGQDEPELVRRCKEGSEAAYAVLVRLHRPRLYSLAYRLIGDTALAEDVVQETFLAAFRGLDRFEPKPSLAPWLNTILVRTAGKAAGDRRRTPASLQAPVSPTNGHVEGGISIGEGLVDVDPSGDPVRSAESAELRRAVDEAIAALPFQQRVAVVLRHVMGLDYAEAAIAMEVPLNTFKSHLLRGTRQLRDTLAPTLAPEPRTPLLEAGRRDGTAGALGIEPAAGTPSPATSPSSRG
ncbi:MAG: hypothetical protein RL338_530 [Chloroflexota bacterium]